MEQSKPKARGKGARPAMVHVNVRLPAEILDYYKQWPSYTKMIRTVLTNYAESQKT